MAKYTALDIAEWFLAYNRYIEALTDGDGITNLKLQKLLYYTQVFHLSLKGVPLFDESIEAWRHRPIVLDVYEQYKSFRSSFIIYDEDYYREKVDKETKEFLELIYDTFAIYSAWVLEI